MTGLPYPTPTRLRMADAITARHVRHYHFVKPFSLDTVRDVHVTARVAELVAAGLAELGDPDGEDEVRNWSTVRLTPEGMAWVTRARTAKISTEGPVSTSPETGPLLRGSDLLTEQGPAAVDQCCPAYPNCHEPLPGPLVEERTEGGA